MNNPNVLCICPAHARPDFVERARKCFVSQCYEPKQLWILDTSGYKESVGAIRNRMVRHESYAPWADVIAHFDYDDWSAPHRLQYQLDFMQQTGAPVVGFYDMLFYDAVQDRVLYYDSLMKNYGLGTSLFYKREVWERVPFPDQTPEDTTWQHQVGHDNIRGCSSIVDGKPLMIQVLHGANAAASAAGAIFQPASPELDAEVRRILSVA